MINPLDFDRLINFVERSNFKYSDGFNYDFEMTLGFRVMKLILSSSEVKKLFKKVDNDTWVNYITPKTMSHLTLTRILKGHLNIQKRLSNEQKLTLANVLSKRLITYRDEIWAREDKKNNKRFNRFIKML